MGNRILIIGAGLGGLALAQGLIRVGFNVSVFERDESPTSRPQGHRIFIRSMGMEALTALLTPEKLGRLSTAKRLQTWVGVSPVPMKKWNLFSVYRDKRLVFSFFVQS